MIKITSGEFKGRSLRTPPHLNTRPTSARLRQAWMNALQTHLQDAIVLDLFAGSGALGFEALSRGAQKVVFVEKDKKTTQLIGENGEDLKVKDRIVVIHADLFEIEGRLSSLGPYDLIFADPPYHLGLEQRLLNAFSWNNLLGENSLLCCEWARTPRSKSELGEDLAGKLRKDREKDYGDSVLTFFRLARRVESEVNESSHS